MRIWSERGGGFGEEITYIDQWSLKEVDGLLTSFLPMLGALLSFILLHLYCYTEWANKKKFTPVNTHFNSRVSFSLGGIRGHTKALSYRGPRKAAQSKDNPYLH